MLFLTPEIEGLYFFVVVYPSFLSSPSHPPSLLPSLLPSLSLEREVFTTLAKTRVVLSKSGNGRSYLLLALKVDLIFLLLNALKISFLFQLKK